MSRNSSCEALVLATRIQGENNRSVTLLTPDVGIVYTTLFEVTFEFLFINVARRSILRNILNQLVFLLMMKIRITNTTPVHISSKRSCIVVLLSIVARFIPCM